MHFGLTVAKKETSPLEYASSAALNRFSLPIILILVLAFTLRLVDLRVPVIGVHSWRQADTAAMARNFYENRFNILYPQIDWRANTSGYVEGEFPIYSFAVASLYQLLGVHELLARLLSAILSVASVYFLYLLGQKLIGERPALWASGFFAFLPLQIFYGRVIMPEPLLLLCITAGAFFFYRWYEDGRLGQAMLSGAFISVGCLIKPPTMYVGLPLAYLAWLRLRRRMLWNHHLWLVIIIVLVPFVLWYYHAHQLYLQTGLTFGVWGYGSDKWGNWGHLLAMDFWRTVLWDHLARMLAYVGVPALVAGLALGRVKAEEYMIDFWLLGVLVFIVVVANGNYVHEYYLLPVMIPVSLALGKLYGKHISLLALKPHPKQVALILLLGGIVLAGTTLLVSSYYEPELQPSVMIALSSQVMATTNPNDLIVSVDRMDPTLLYLSHRKGWDVSLEQFRQAEPDAFPGAKYVVGINKGKPFFNSLENKETRGE